MGCDIHCYIEYRHKNRPDDRRWRDFGGRINPGRNYWMFGAMAGVLSDRVPPVAEPRGMPEDAAWESQGDSRCYIVDKPDDIEGHCSREDAERWVKSGSSSYLLGNDGKAAWVTHPDWHTHSWLTADEFAKALSLGLDGQYDEPEYKAILAAMRSFELLGYESRLVFWFDN